MAPELVYLADGCLDGAGAQQFAVIGTAEVLNFLVEALWYRAWRGDRPWLTSLLANSASAGTGLLLHHFVGWP